MFFLRRSSGIEIALFRQLQIIFFFRCVCLVTSTPWHIRHIAASYYMFFSHLNRSIDWFIWRNLCTVCITHNAYTITNSTTKFENTKRGHMTILLHPHMTCIWISIIKKKNAQLVSCPNNSNENTVAHTHTHIHDRKLYCFFMRIVISIFSRSMRSIASWTIWN